MKKIRGSSLKNILCREKVLRVFVDEAQSFLYGLAILILGMEFILLLKIHSFDVQRSVFVVSTLSFYLLFCMLESVFRIFLKNRSVAVLSVLPGVILFFLVSYLNGFSSLSYSLIFSVCIRLFLCYVPGRQKLFLFLCFPLDLAALGLRFFGHVLLGDFPTDKFLFVSLVVLSFYSLQTLIFHLHKERFPFHFFLLIALLLMFLPVHKNPIDWSFVEHMAEKISIASENALYQLGGVFPGKSYSAGYSSLSVKGGKIKRNNKPQLILSISDFPYHTFTDTETGKKKMVKKTTYLPGNKKWDVRWLCDFLALLKENEVDSKQAALFSKVSQMDVEYVFLDTKDEILPEGCLYYTCEGDSGELHQKGYRLHAVYLDIDFGSPYLTEYYKNPKKLSYLSYEEACDYMEELYDVSLDHMVPKEEYTKAIQTEAFLEADVETSGTNQNQKNLADEITAGCMGDYEKCLAIESYLRQFPYSTGATGGYQSDSSLESAAGMADIADRFLFETKKGYCVHYTAAMVTLLRLNGIPARVVMGYRYDFPYKLQNDYTVSAGCAHAWPEAYIENVGWVSFEPTGAYPSASLRSWKKVAQGDGPLPEVKEPEVEKSETGDKSEKGAHHRLHILVILGVVLGSIAALLLFIILGTVVIRAVRYHFSDGKKRVKIDVELIKKMLQKKTGTEVKERGLLYDYLLIAPVEEQENLKKVFDLYYRSVYGTGKNGEISEDESRFVREVYERVKA